MVLHKKRVEIPALKSVPFAGLTERGIKATKQKALKCLCFIIIPLNFICNILTLSKKKKKDHAEKKSLECVLPKIRIDTFT